MVTNRSRALRFIVTLSGPSANPVTVSYSTGGGTATSATNFTVIPAPTITGFSPKSGSVGTVVTISGTHLSNAKSVTFNGVAAVIDTDSTAQITATVPTGATTGRIKVTTAGGSAT